MGTSEPLLSNLTEEKRKALILYGLHLNTVTAVALEMLLPEKKPRRKRRVWSWPYLQRRTQHGHYEIETLEHFLLDCEEYSAIRQVQTFLQNIENQTRDNLIANILVFDPLSYEEVEDRKSYVIKIWNRRQNKIHQQ